MQIQENTKYHEVLHYFLQRFPVRTTDRKGDLEKLSQTKKSFILYSVSRNGATTLFKNIINVKDGKIFYGKYGSKIENLKQEMTENGKKLFLVDETNRVYRNNSEKETTSFFIEASKERQIGLRIHPSIDKKILDRLISNGFELFKLEQMQLENYRTLVNSKFQEIGIEIPEEIISEANSRFNALCPSNLFIGTYFKTMIEEPEKLSIDYVMKIFAERYTWAKQHQTKI